jgi:hypothetical protein
MLKDGDSGLANRQVLALVDAQNQSRAARIRGRSTVGSISATIVQAGDYNTLSLEIGDRETHRRGVVVDWIVIDDS